MVKWLGCGGLEIKSIMKYVLKNPYLDISVGEGFSPSRLIDSITNTSLAIYLSCSLRRKATN